MDEMRLNEGVEGMCGCADPQIYTSDQSPERWQKNLWSESWEFIQGLADTAFLLLRL